MSTAKLILMLLRRQQQQHYLHPGPSPLMFFQSDQTSASKTIIVLLRNDNSPVPSRPYSTAPLKATLQGLVKRPIHLELIENMLLPSFVMTIALSSPYTASVPLGTL
jgi:hypothetical protein